MGLFKPLPIPKIRPPIEHINLENPTSEDLKRIANRAAKPEGHRIGASFHFRTVIIQNKILLLDGNNKIIKSLELDLHNDMSEKEKERIIIKVTTELRSFASNLFIKFDGDTLQMGGFLFD